MPQYAPSKVHTQDQRLSHQLAPTKGVSLKDQSALLQYGPSKIHTQDQRLLHQLALTKGVSLKDQSTLLQ